MSAAAMSAADISFADIAAAVLGVLALLVAAWALRANLRSAGAGEDTARTARSAEARQGWARLSVESYTRASDFTGYVVRLSNVGFASARHVTVTLIDKAERKVTSGSQGPVHPKEAIDIPVLLGSSKLEYPLRIRSDWKPWNEKLDEEVHETSTVSTLRVQNPDVENSPSEQSSEADVTDDTALSLDQATPREVAKRLRVPAPESAEPYRTPMTWAQCLELGTESRGLGQVVSASDWRNVPRGQKLRVVVVDVKTVRWLALGAGYDVLENPTHEGLRCSDDGAEPLPQGYVEITPDDQIYISTD